MQFVEVWRLEELIQQNSEITIQPTNHFVQPKTYGHLQLQEIIPCPQLTKFETCGALHYVEQSSQPPNCVRQVSGRRRRGKLVEDGKVYGRHN